MQATRFRFLTPMLLGLCLVGLAACAPYATPTRTEGQIPPVAPEATRVWFFRGWDSLSGQGDVYAAAPTIFANGQPVGDIPTGTEFFRDFAPGAYTFTVEPYGLPTPQAVTLQLAAGKQSYLQVQWVASWEFGYPEADFSFAPNTFAVLSVQPQLAQAYLATLTYLGLRGNRRLTDNSGSCAASVRINLASYHSPSSLWPDPSSYPA